MHLLLGALHCCLFFSDVHRGAILAGLGWKTKVILQQRDHKEQCNEKKKLLSKKEKACFLIT